MERLTEKELYDGKVQYTKCSKTNCKDRCCDCPVEQEIPVRLKYYEDAEEQGLLLWLKVKPENTVYVIVKKDISPQKVVEIHISCNGIEIMTNRRVFHVSAIGKTVFLTREEAESALAEKGE